MTDMIPQVAREENATNGDRKLLLHCGARVASRDDVNAVPTPRGTSTWFPLAHGDLLDKVMSQLGQGEFVIGEERHALSHDGARYFGTLTVSRKTNGEGSEPTDYGFVVGLRNSHDKSYPAGLVAGTRVFVCDNLCFSGEIRISRKHTRFAVRDLRTLTARAVGQLGDRFLGLRQRVAAYKALTIGDAEAHDLVIRAVDRRAITPSQVPAVLEHWRKPKHEEFRARTGWSLFNAITEIHKEINPHTALARGEALHGLFDQRIGFSSS